MKPGRVTLTKILDEAITLFNDVGYHNTSLEKIAASCNLKKSSLYHHIPSRQSLIVQVFERLLEKFKTQCISPVYHNDLSNDARLNEFILASTAFSNDPIGGRLVMQLGIEIGNTIPKIAELMQNYFQTWEEAILRLLDQCDNLSKTPTEHAEDILSQIQGAILLNRFESKPALIKRSFEALRSL